jgi:trimeric autotransporter adhesin
MKTKLSLLLISALFIFVALSPKMLATDLGGVLPNNNTADGTGVLISLTTGVNNSGFGFQALNHDSSGSGNTATGSHALFSNTGGSYNTASGEFALSSNTTGIGNTAIGDSALLANGSGASNTAVGVSALRNNVSGTKSTAVGHDALSQNNANDGTAVGYQALLSNTTGIDNTACGFQALYTNTAGYYNTAVGAGSLFHNNGTQNTAVGNGALNSNTSGTGNTAIGFLALKKNTTGLDNTAIGYQPLQSNISGRWNVAIGIYAGSYITGDGNVCIGSAYGVGGMSNTTWISNIASTAQPNSVYVTVGSDGKLGYQSSSRRYKDEIKPIDEASEAIFALQPRSFRYKKEADPARSLDYGFVAEEVAAVNPDLAVRDEEGKIITVRYNAINAMLLNEFLKEHRKVEEQQATITELKAAAAKQQSINAEQRNQIKALAAGLQKVSAQFEISKADSRMASKSR